MTYRRRWERGVKRQTITLESNASRCFKPGMLIQFGGGEPFVIKKIKDGQAVVAEPILTERQRNVLHKFIYWLDWPNRHIFRPIVWWFWERKNADVIKGFRLVIDEIMRRRRVDELEGRKGK